MLHLLSVLLALATAAPIDTPHGFAMFYNRYNFVGQTGIQADLALPEQKDNKSWYACWIMLLPYAYERTAPFIQVGLIRWPGSGSYPWYFYALREPGKPLVFKTARPAQSETAVARIQTTATEITLIVDGQTLVREPRILITGNSKTYFQLGDEVSAYGDSMSGRVSDVEALSDNVMVPISPDCAYSDAGITLQTGTDGWGASGHLQHGAGTFYSVPQFLRLKQCT